MRDFTLKVVKFQNGGVAISNQPIRKCGWVVEMRARIPGSQEQPEHNISYEAQGSRPNIADSRPAGKPSQVFGRNRILFQILEI